jgi:phospholipid/cholesterol/gamma-HCH transport system substrate-binding protein
MRPRLLAGSAIVLAIAAILVVVVSAGSHPRIVRAAFQGAINVVPGQEVRLAGVKVGHVESVHEADGQAVVALAIDDAHAWPLRQGTIARLRYGTTVSYAARYVELFPGPRNAPALASGAVLSSADTVTPVEFDQIFNIYDAEARRNLRGLIANGAAALEGRAGDLAGALRQSPAAFDQLAGMMRELGADRNALSVLARQGARASAALEGVDGPLRALLGHLAGTFDEFAAHTAAQQASLERMPATFATTRDALRRLDASLGGLDRLISDIGPGARGLVRLARPASDALRELRSVAPLATATLATGSRSAPSITALLNQGTTFMPSLGTVLGQLTPAFGCLRPYSPEIAGAVSTWAGFAKNYDALAHYARTLIQTLPYNPGAASSSSVLKSAPGTTYAFPRPPGLNAGQTWLQPQCSAGSAALHAAADPEAGR